MRNFAKQIKTMDIKIIGKDTDVFPFYAKVKIEK